VPVPDRDDQNQATDLQPLFDPLLLGRLSLPNRIVMAPMTRQRSPGGTPGEDVAQYYARRAAGGVGLIITEGTTIDDPASSPGLDIPQFHGDAAVAGWRRVREAVHAAGGRIVPQLWHLGIARNLGTKTPLAEPSISPSGLTLAGGQAGVAMTEARIEAVIASFARAARLALDLGFDGVELHGAHGYLIDQFFWDLTNRRDDAWGGDPARRTRFGAEIVRAVRRATGPEFPIIFRWSQWKTGNYEARIAKDPHELASLLEPLTEAGVTAYHCSTRRHWEAEFPESGASLNLAGWTKALTGRPTIAVGSVGLARADAVEVRGNAVEVDVDRLNELAHALGRGEFDLVAVGRAILATPDWPNLVHERRFNDLRGYNAHALAELT